jgi:hypothetical protein
MIASCGEPVATATPSGLTTASAEQPGVFYTNTQYNYRVEAPGQMVQAPDGSVSAQRGVEAMTISVVTGSNAADPNAYATSDQSQLQPATAGYQLWYGPAPRTLASAGHGGSHIVTKVIYASSSTNKVSGDPQTLVNVRYYIPKDSSTLAVMTYSNVDSQYDPQVADNFASTFAWL